MSGPSLNRPASFETDMEPIAQAIRSLAQSYQGNSLALLALLRAVESLHQEIRDGLFQEALPNNRQALYNLLRDIELSGGWPYIQRMPLESLLKHFGIDGNVDTATLLAVICTPEETLLSNQDD